MTVLGRVGDGWSETVVRGGTIELPEIGVSLPVDAVYAKVRFG